MYLKPGANEWYKYGINVVDEWWVKDTPAKPYISSQKEPVPTWR